MTAAEALERLKGAFAEQRLAQAYLLDSADAAGAADLIARFLEMVLCTGAAPPCGRCRACRLVRQGTHPDVFRVEPEKTSRRISIEQIRALSGDVFKTSYAGGWKACVVSAADRLTAEAANAFLKTLEEPPPRCVFFLVTDSPQALLPTILSRCQRIGLSDAGVGLPDETRARIAAILARDAPGGVLGGLARGDELARLLSAMKKAVADAEKESLADEAVETEDEVLEARISARYRALRGAVMRVVETWHRDVLLLTAGAGDVDLAEPSRAADTRRQAAAVGYAGALRRLRLVEEMNRRLERNMPEAQVLALGFCRMQC
ncbi:MAG: hypothetical protein FJ225_01375 [Lentisphaerae bacterium]|nr:hypothetical protein [Lentisphaerota bacterium]